MTSFALGLDIGTQSSKALLLDIDTGRVIATAAAPHAQIGGLEAGASEQDPQTWIDAVREATVKLWKQPHTDAGAVVVVGVSGQQHGLVMLDGAEEVVRPAKLWNDTTSAAEAESVSADVGRVIPPGYTAPKIRWMQRHEPANWATTAHVLLPHDYVNFKLTGRMWTDAGDASGTGLLDPKTQTWDAAAVAALDAGGSALQTRLPEIAPHASLPAVIDPGGAELCGVRRDVAVATGSGDNMMSAIGAGATRPGRVVVSLGTSGTVFAYSVTPVFDTSGTIAAFCDATGAWLPLLCTMNATGVPDEIVMAFPGETHASLSAAAADLPAGADGLTLLPYFVGERVPNLPDAFGAITGIRPGLLRAPHLYRAALEGATAGLAAGLDRMQALGLPVESVRLVGGGSRNQLWRRIVADILQVPVTTPAESESAALGAAIHALWSWRRVDEPGLAADEVSEACVSVLGSPIEPDPASAETYGELAARIADQTQRLFARSDDRRTRAAR